ncbi:uncharacterized protein BCR38DRAFT_412149 [Pseudomassariella vexata]|uniref:Uncharacterized protein n=1 Tax=Pseudomassariella vexata TaxID=1141098 RepID=A0A1Y2DL36_9PEZI|nr:uncharacterized protein BCR38DRAFT_412149 [Pseudomassariella vexata]ORY59931.1 hypothetical protein BCR38DRAFT_412149 [Pseudomassariella vexata]
MWRISERWVKNNRHPKNKTFAITGKDHSVLAYSDGALLLSLAIVDGALFGSDTLDDLWQQEIPPDENEKIYRWYDYWQKILITRAIDKTRKVSPSKLMTRGTYLAIYKACLRNEGYYKVSGGMHPIRRYLGKRIDGKYTETERSQHILQSDPRIFDLQKVLDFAS